MNQQEQIIDKLLSGKLIEDDELAVILETDEYDNLLKEAADSARRQVYGTDVYIRGLIEFTNYCENNCFYCGIRRDNSGLSRYRLMREEILSCCDAGYKLGFRTFVLQGGEDPFYDDDEMCKIIQAVKSGYPDCALTLSTGEKSYKSYKMYFDAGADRYLLRHETADAEHYSQLHPKSMSLENRKECLMNLKSIGFQTGSGFMVGSPYQKTEYLVKDIKFLIELKPEMIGIGPYITHHKTPFKAFNSGSLELTLRLISILRLIFPYALIPATTALSSIASNGRELGLKAGANVVMPNLSPPSVRNQYSLYDGKVFSGEEAAERLSFLKKQVNKAGYNVVVTRGDAKTLT